MLFMWHFFLSTFHDISTAVSGKFTGTTLCDTSFLKHQNNGILKLKVPKGKEKEREKGKKKNNSSLKCAIKNTANKDDYNEMTLSEKNNNYIKQRKHHQQQPNACPAAHSTNFTANRHCNKTFQKMQRN